MLTGTLIFTGLFGAFLSKKIQSRSIAPWWTVVPSLITGLIWGQAVRRFQNLSVLSAWFDVIYTAAYVFGFVLLGDRLTALQVFGFILSLVGVALMSI